jgi:D-3-phosphoglycerate dehydrogenase
VNFPEAKMPRTGDSRLAIAHQNIPNMVGQISTILAEESANIVDMLNKSRDEVAYTLVDIEGGVSDTVVNNLKQVEGILMVRSL